MKKNIFINSRLKLFETTVIPASRSLVLPWGIAVSDSMSFTSSMLNSEDWCGQWWGLHLEFVGQTRGMRFYMNGMLECNKSPNTDTINPGGRLRYVIIGNWRATLRTFHPIVGQNEHYNGGRRPNTWVTEIKEFTRWKRWDNWQNVAVCNLAFRSNQCLSLYNLPWVENSLL